MSDNREIVGRKVFFLHPHSVIETDIFEEIIEHEYEAYFLTDHEIARQLLKKFNDSIIFINIDEELSEPEWETYVRRLIEDEELSSIKVGILSYNEDPDLIEKYLMNIGVQCGFTKLRLGIKESTRIILTSLHANEAKGRRKFVRASTHGSDRATFNVRIDGKTTEGHIWDISVAGMAITFDTHMELEPKTILKEIQLKLWGTLVLLHGVVTATRSGEGGGYVVMFGKSPNSAARVKIHAFIHRWLQQEMEEIIKQT